MNQAPSMLKPALISGVVFGIAGSIPVINWINCACCALIIGCGFLAAFLYSKSCRQAGAEFNPGKGAVLGLLTGAVFGVVGTVINSVFSILTGGLDPASMREAIDANPMISDPQAAEEAMRLFESVGPAFFILIFALIWIVSGVIFAALGGLIGGSAFKVEPAPIEAGGWSSTPPAAPPNDPPPPPPVDPGL